MSERTSRTSPAACAAHEPLFRSTYSGTCGRLTWWKSLAVVATGWLAYVALLSGVLGVRADFADGTAAALVLRAPVLLLAAWVLGGATTRRLRSLGVRAGLAWPAIALSIAVGLTAIGAVAPSAFIRAWIAVAPEILREPWAMLIPWALTIALFVAAFALILAPALWLGCTPARTADASRVAAGAD